MKTNTEYILRNIVGETVLIPTGKTTNEFNGLITLNSVAALIWECISNGNTKDQILKAITEKYEVSEDVARPDLDEFIEVLLENNMIEL